MAYSQVTYTGDGSTQNFTFPFPYIDKADIFLFVNGTSAAFTFLNDAAIRCTAIPVGGAIVQIKRATQKTTVPVNFTDGATLLERDLDLLAAYALYAAQESDDNATGAMVTGSSADFTARGLRIRDLAAGVLPTDAVNLAQNTALVNAAVAVSMAATVATTVTSSVAAAVSGVASFVSSAQASAAQAAASATASGASSTASSGSATASGSSAAAAAASRDLAITSAAQAAISAASAATLPVLSRVIYTVGLSAGAAVGQTVFTGLVLSAGNIDVFYNGVKLLAGTDFNTTATTLTLARPAANRDVLEITSISAPFMVVDCGTY